MEAQAGVRLGVGMGTPQSMVLQIDGAYLDSSVFRLTLSQLIYFSLRLLYLS